MLNFLVIVHNATKGFNTMEIKLTEDGENLSVTINPVKKIKEDFNQKRMSVLNRAVGLLKEVNEVPTTVVEPSKQDTVGMVVTKTLACSSPKERMLMKKKINDILFEAEFHGSEQATGHIELSSYNPLYGVPVARATEQYSPSQFSTL